MSYSKIKEKLENNQTIILDGAVGGELEKIGAPMNEDLWVGKCNIDSPELVLKVHESYINSGVDVITTNTYALTPISMKQYGYKKNIIDWNIRAVEIAKKAVSNNEKEILVAASVSTYGSWHKLGPESHRKNFIEHLKIIENSGVDLIILEAMTSETDTIENLIDCSKDVKLPIWLSVSCALDPKSNKIMLGYQESITHSKAEIYDDFKIAIKKFSSYHSGPILVAHTDIKIMNDSIKIVKENHNGFVGSYPNNGYFEKPHWRLKDGLYPERFLKEAKSWVKNGSQIIGGCCGVGPDLIKPLSVLKK